MFIFLFILLIVGGGSIYMSGIVKSLMVCLQDFLLVEICFYDIDEVCQNMIVLVVEKVICDYSQSIKFIVINDLEVVFSGVYFVFVQMCVGQYKMCEQDEKILLCYGVVGQEICGFGGLVYGLCMILLMVEFIDLVDCYVYEKVWIVNYFNLVVIVVEGVCCL